MIKKPYITTDLETTGLNPDSSLIIEVGAIYDMDGVTEINKLPQFRSLVKHDKIVGEEYALNLNKLLIEEAQDTGVSIKEAMESFSDFIKKCSAGDDRITFSGKNFGSFDKEFLRRVMDIDSVMRHRIMDIGNMYFAYFGYIPSLGEINKLLKGSDFVAHTAVEDCMDCVVASRFARRLSEGLNNLIFRQVPLDSDLKDFLNKIEEMGHPF